MNRQKQACCTTSELGVWGQKQCTRSIANSSLFSRGIRERGREWRPADEGPCSAALAPDLCPCSSKPSIPPKRGSRIQCSLILQPSSWMPESRHAHDLDLGDWCVPQTGEPHQATALNTGMPPQFAFSTNSDKAHRAASLLLSASAQHWEASGGVNSPAAQRHNLEWASLVSQTKFRRLGQFEARANLAGNSEPLPPPCFATCSRHSQFLHSSLLQQPPSRTDLRPRPRRLLQHIRDCVSIRPDGIHDGESRAMEGAGPSAGVRQSPLGRTPHAQTSSLAA